MKSRALFLFLLILFPFLSLAEPQQAQKSANPVNAANPTSPATIPQELPFQAVFLLVENSIDASSPTLVVKRHRIVKLLSPSAVQRFATLEFPYTSSDQKITLDEVKITSPDGKVTTVSPDQIKEFTPFEKFPPFDTFKVIDLPLSEVVPGSTLEYRTTKTEQSWSSSNYWEEVFLQEMDPFPILKEQITLIEQEGKQANAIILHGNFPEPQITRQGNTVSRVWTFEKLPPHEAELSMPPAVDILPRLEISTFRSWDDLLHALQTQFFTPVGNADFVKTLQDITKNAATQGEKLRAIYTFVAQTIRSLPNAVADLGKIPHLLDYDATLKQGVGDSRDKAALLNALLQKAGFQSKLVLVSTVGNGLVAKSIPHPLAFNRPVVRVELDGKIDWLDPYVENAPFAYLPPEDQGREAVVLDTGEFVETPISAPGANLREVSAHAKILSNGALEETLELSAQGADNLGIRSILRNMGDQERQQVVAALASQVAKEPQVKAVSLSSVDELSSSFKLGLKFEANNYATVTGDLAFFSLPVSVLNYLKAILVQEKPREYPFLLGNTVDEVQRLELDIPKGYKLRTLPKGTKIENALGSYQASFALVKNKLIFQSKFTVDKIQFTPKEFESLKSLVADKVKLEESKIVLQKIKS